MTDRRFSTADTTMTDIYYILTEAITIHSVSIETYQ